MKYFNVFFAAFVLLAATSCSNESEVTVSNAQTETATVPVRVHVDGFSVSQSEMSVTRGTAIDSYEGVKALTLAFYKADGTEQTQLTQFKGSTSSGQTFGEFSLNLPMGSYTMVLVGRGHSAGDEFAIISPTSAAYTEGYPRETFVATQEVNITTNTAQELTATLDRVVAKVVVASTDNRTADVSKIRTTFSAGGKSFNPSTGLATENDGYSKTLTIPSTAVETITATSYLFLATDEQTVDVTIETIDADNNVLFSKTVTNVPLKRNRETTLTGAMFTAGASAGSGKVKACFQAMPSGSRLDRRSRIFTS